MSNHPGNPPQLRDAPPHVRDLDDPIVIRALDLIWSDQQRMLTVSDVADRLPVTRRTLDRRFAELVGHSVLEEILVARMSRATRLLRETDLPIKTVAHLAGFSSTERMRVAFTERLGLAPSAYREQAGQE